MSVVIIGGNECMVCQYEKICKKHGCKAKVFVKDFDIHYKEADFGIDNTFSECLLKQTSKSCINEFYNKRHDLINRINENTHDEKKCSRYSRRKFCRIWSVDTVW